MSHHQQRKRRREKHLMWKRYDKHFREVTPDFDLGDQGLDEIREKVHGRELRPFRDDRLVDLDQIIDELGAE